MSIKYLNLDVERSLIDILIILILKYPLATLLWYIIFLTSDKEISGDVRNISVILYCFLLQKLAKLLHIYYIYNIVVLCLYVLFFTGTTAIELYYMSRYMGYLSSGFLFMVQVRIIFGISLMGKYFDCKMLSLSVSLAIFELSAVSELWWITIFNNQIILIIIIVKVVNTKIRFSIIWYACGGRSSYLNMRGIIMLHILVLINYIINISKRYSLCVCRGNLWNHWSN